VDSARQRHHLPAETKLPWLHTEPALFAASLA